MKLQARSFPSKWFTAAALALLVAAPACDEVTSLGNDASSQVTALVSPDVVISQLYGGGGSSGAPFTNDYVELFNRGAGSVSVTGWSVQYASATGSSWAKANLSGTIPAGGYYLVQLASNGSIGAALPAPDATGAMNMSGSSGKVALVTNQTLLSCGSTACLPNGAIRDLVGYGSAGQFEGSSAAPTLSVTSAGRRASGGCTDTDDNGNDFATSTPSPRSSRSARAPCGGGGGGGVDAGVPDAGSPPPGGDGTPTRVACTGSFGSAMTATFGRLDGFLVSIVNVNGSSTCRGDNNHVHLQVRVNGRVEDIAVNVQSTSGIPNVAFRTINGALAGGAWSEGWHPGRLFDYVNNLGVHSNSFTSLTLSQLQSQLNSLLANANHVSIFATGFDGTGGHNIHRQPTNHDGAIVINPTTSNPQYLLFHFANQTF